MASSAQTVEAKAAHTLGMAGTSLVSDTSAVSGYVSGGGGGKASKKTSAHTSGGRSGGPQGSGSPGPSVAAEVVIRVNVYDVRRKSHPFGAAPADEVVDIVRRYAILGLRGNVLRFIIDVESNVILHCEGQGATSLRELRSEWRSATKVPIHLVAPWEVKCLSSAVAVCRWRSIFVARLQALCRGR